MIYWILWLSCLTKPIIARNLNKANGLSYKAEFVSETNQNEISEAENSNTQKKSIEIPDKQLIRAFLMAQQLMNNYRPGRKSNKKHNQRTKDESTSNQSESTSLPIEKIANAHINKKKYFNKPSADTSDETSVKISSKGKSSNFKGVESPADSSDAVRSQLSKDGPALIREILKSKLTGGPSEEEGAKPKARRKHKKAEEGSGHQEKNVWAPKRSKNVKVKSGILSDTDDNSN